MTRCLYCKRILWPWQSQGWRITVGEVRRWHGRCWPWSGEVVIGYINPDGSGHGNWTETEDTLE